MTQSYKLCFDQIAEKARARPKHIAQTAARFSDALFRRRFAVEQDFKREHGGEKDQRRAGVRRADCRFQFPAARFSVRLLRRALHTHRRSRAADNLLRLRFSGINGDLAVFEFNRRHLAQK